MFPYVYKTDPYAHQRAVFERTAEEEYFALTMEQGTGKTKVILDTAAHLYNQGRINALLVLAPNGVHRNWLRKEVPAHLPDYVKRTTSAWSSSPNKNQRLQHEAVFKGEGLRILTINIEAMSVPRVAKEARLFLNANEALCAVDESTRIKTPTSERTKATLALAPLAKYRRIMTGTPVTQSPLDVFSQYNFLQKNFFNTESYTVFRARYAELMPKDHPLIQHIMRTQKLRFAPSMIATDSEGRPIYKNLDELRALTDKYSFRVLKKDCLDLPEKVYYRRPVQLSPVQEKAYRDLMRRLKDGLQVGEVAGRAIQKMNVRMYQQRILCGVLPGIMTEDGKDRPLMPWNQNPRIHALLAELAECGGQAIIWCRFVEDVRIVSEALIHHYSARDVVQYYGAVDDDARERNIDRFESGDARWFVGTAGAGGIGITLVKAREVHYFSNGYKLEERLQSEDRAHRIGQRFEVRYVDYEVEDSADTHILQSFLDKKDVADEITGDEFSKWI